MTARRRPRAMTRTEPVAGVSVFIGAPDPARTRREQCSTVSVARIPGTDAPLWTYHRIEGTGTPWIVTYQPTGQREQVSSLSKARRWTATPEAVRYLRDRAARVVADDGRSPGVVIVDGAGRVVPENPEVCAARVAEAERVLAIHDALNPQPALPGG